MKKYISVLIFLLILSIPLSASAQIEQFEGEDDDECNHSWSEVDYDYVNNLVTYECTICSEQKKEQLEDYLEDLIQPPMMLMMVEADGGYPEEQHDYRVVAFDGTYGNAVVMCWDCGEYFIDSWADHLTVTDGHGNVDNSRYVYWFDRNHDDYINGKDFLYLLKDYTEMFDEKNSDLIFMLENKNFTYKEKFFYCYFTVLIVVMFLIMIICIRRCH